MEGKEDTLNQGGVSLCLWCRPLIFHIEVKAKWKIMYNVKTWQIWWQKILLLTARGKVKFSAMTVFRQYPLTILVCV